MFIYLIVLYFESFIATGNSGPNYNNGILFVDYCLVIANYEMVNHFFKYSYSHKYFQY